MAGRLDVDRIKRAFDLVAYCRAELPGGMSRGGTYKMKCPFHDDRSPSCSVFCSEAFVCHGCGVKGSSITFVMRFTGLEFLEAVRLMAQYAGISSPEESVATQRANRIAAAKYKRTEAERQSRIVEMNRILQDLQQCDRYIADQAAWRNTVAGWGLPHAEQLLGAIDRDIEAAVQHTCNQFDRYMWRVEEERSDGRETG